MKDLYNKLGVLKIILNSHYGNGNTDINAYEDISKIRRKIEIIKKRKQKINQIYNV